MIEDFLKPPTDNLYKFMTMFGLILFLISVTYPPWLVHRSALAFYEAQRDSELLDVEIADLTAKSKRFTDEADRQIELMKAQTTAVNKLTGKKSLLADSEKAKISVEIKESKTEREKDDKKVYELYNAAHEAASSAQRKGIEAAYKLRVISWESWYGRILMLVCVLGCVSGLVVARKGFNLWSLRVQIYQDAILKKQAALQSESEPEPAEQESK